MIRSETCPFKDLAEQSDCLFRGRCANSGVHADSQGFEPVCPFGQHRRETGRRQAATPAWMAGGRWCTRIAETRPSTGRVASHTVAPKVLCATNAFRARSSSSLSLDPGGCGVFVTECQRWHAKCASQCQERRCTYCRRSGTSVEACGASRDCSPDAVSGSRRAIAPAGV